MASINGITIKALKKFTDHEGAEIAQGNIYYNNKKLGFWTQDSWGGCDEYEFNENILKNEVEKFKNSDLVEEKYKDITCLDTLLYHLLNLKEDEDIFKKNKKKGYGATAIYSDDFHMSHVAFPESWSDERIKKEADAYVEKLKPKFFKNWDGSYKLYKSLSDFDLTV